MLINKSSLSVRHVTCASSDRYENVQIKNGVTTATDGRIMAQVTALSTDGIENFPDVGMDVGMTSFTEECFLTKEQSANVYRFLNKKKPSSILENAILGRSSDSSDPVLIATDLENSIKSTPIVSSSENPITFPTIESVIPTKLPTWRIAFTLDVLEKLCKVARDFYGKTELPNLSFYGYSELEQVLILSKYNDEGQKLKIIAMPFKKDFEIELTVNGPAISPAED